MAKNPLQQLLIPRRSRSCAKTGAKFEPGMAYISIITDGKKEGEYFREDILLSWWTEHGSEEELQKTRSFWRGRVPLKSEAPKTSDEMLEQSASLLREYLNSDSSRDRIKAFLLAIFLQRKKKLLFRHDIVHDGKMAYIYEFPESEEVLTVEVVELSQEELQEIQQELNHEIAALS